MGTQMPVKKANKLASTKLGGKLVNDYWEMVFRAREEGKLVCWYEGSAINPFLQAADICWVHGEAYSAMLAAHRSIIIFCCAAESFAQKALPIIGMYWAMN